MVELAAMLGSIAIVLTFISSYRLFEFSTGGSPALGLLISAAITTSFMLIFEYVLIMFGLAAFIAPFVVVHYHYNRIPVFSPAIGRAITFIKQQVGIEVHECNNCDTTNESANDYCKNCGQKLNT